MFSLIFDLYSDFSLIEQDFTLYSLFSPIFLSFRNPGCDKCSVAFLEETVTQKLQPAQNVLFLINNKQNLIPHAMTASPAIKS